MENKLSWITPKLPCHGDTVSETVDVDQCCLLSLSLIFFFNFYLMPPFVTSIEGISKPVLKLYNPFM